MRPEDLKFPFSQDGCRIVFHDRVWYIPSNLTDYSTYHFPGWRHENFFGNQQPVNIEYCSGNGAWIAEKAKNFPNVNWVAVEKKFMRVKKIWSKIRNYKLTNLIAICGEAKNVTVNYLSDESINEIFINFPDPWPKHRHNKHRIIQPNFLDQINRVLKKDSFFTFVTDDLEYSKWMIKMMGKNNDFNSCYPDPFFATEYEGYGTSYFDSLWREKGKLIRYHKFVKQNAINHREHREH